MPQLVLTILHQVSLEWKAHNVLNRDELHLEGCANSGGIHEVPRIAEGEYLKMLYSLHEMQGAGLELGHLAICQSGGAKYRDTNRFIDFLRE